MMRVLSVPSVTPFFLTRIAGGSIGTGIGLYMLRNWSGP